MKFLSDRNAGLAEYLEEKWAKPQVKAVKKAFNRLGLPLPGKGEYTGGLDGVIVFLNDIGSVLRLDVIAKTDEHRFRHSHILQPIGNRRRGKVLFELYPGVICPASEKSVDYLCKALNKSDLDFDDCHHMNAGYLPGTRQFPVVIDPGAVLQIYDYDAGRLKPVAQESGNGQGEQDRLYGSLRRAFNAAWPEHEKWPEPKKMWKFWKLCRAEKENGTLAADWLSARYTQESGFDKDNDYKNIINGSTAYARRWKAANNG
jgi:hypothetical protein